MPEMTQVWTATIDGVAHRVTATSKLRHYAEWYADGERVAARGGMEGRLRLHSDEHGRLEVRYGALGAPRRASLAGLDLVPDPGSPAAGFEERVRARPHLYAAIQTAVGVARVVVPVLIGLVAVRFALSFDWPNLPTPDLPDVPWPDLPEVPVPDVTLPGWVRWVLHNAHFVIPVLVAFTLAQAEIRRRRRQDELRAEHAAGRDQQHDEEH